MNTTMTMILQAVGFIISATAQQFPLSSRSLYLDWHKSLKSSKQM